MWLPDIEFSIQIPTVPFRIHPDIDRNVGPLLCVFEHGKWWLAHPDTVTPGQLGVAVWVNLYEGVQVDGMPFLMPVFRYAREVQSDPFGFLTAAVNLARSHWISIEGAIAHDACRTVLADERLPEVAEWSPYELADLVDIGFGGRYIGSWRDVAVHLVGSREFEVHVPRSDYYYWMRKQYDPDDLQLNDDRGDGVRQPLGIPAGNKFQLGGVTS